MTLVTAEDTDHPTDLSQMKTIETEAIIGVPDLTLTLAVAWAETPCLLCDSRQRNRFCRLGRNGEPHAENIADGNRRACPLRHH